MTLPIYIKMEPVRKSPDDHPEPEFRPQSCGKDADGRLIPLTLSILLLNLNDIPRSPSMMMLPQPSDRKNSFAHQQRKHHYRTVYLPPTDNPVLPIPVPDSPSLDPTLLGGLPPLRLLLSLLVSNSAMESPLPALLVVPGFHLVVPQRQPMYIRSTPKPATLPVLFPVQTPLEEPPITPLTLTHLGPTWTSYFDDVMELANES